MCSNKDTDEKDESLIGPGLNVVDPVTHGTPFDPTPLNLAPIFSVVDPVTQVAGVPKTPPTSLAPGVSVVAKVRHAFAIATTSPRGSALNSQTTVNTSACSSTTWGRLAYNQA
jgi:hypothetical protein